MISGLIPHPPTPSSGTCRRRPAGDSRRLPPSLPSAPRRARLILTVLFVVLLAAFAAGIWGTIIRPPAYEVRGQIVARPAANMLLVRHEALPALGMEAMELMAIFADPAMLEASGVRPGDRVRLTVRRTDDQLVLLRIDRRPGP